MPVEHIVHRHRRSHLHSLTATRPADQPHTSAVRGEASLVVSMAGMYFGRRDGSLICASHWWQPYLPPLVGVLGSIVVAAAAFVGVVKNNTNYRLGTKDGDVPTPECAFCHHGVRKATSCNNIDSGVAAIK